MHMRCVAHWNTMRPSVSRSRLSNSRTTCTQGHQAGTIHMVKGERAPAHTHNPAGMQPGCRTSGGGCSSEMRNVRLQAGRGAPAGGEPHTLNPLHRW